MVLSEKKTLLLLTVAGLAFLAFWQILSSNAYRPRAALPLVNISLAPDATSLAINETKGVKVVIRPATSGNKVSGFDITFKTAGPLKIQSIGQPSVLATGNTSVFTLVKKTTTRAFYTINLPNSQLPNAILLPISVVGDSPGGQATLTIDKTTTKITGNIAGNVYGFGAVEKAVFSVSSIVATSTPGVSLTPPPTPTCLVADCPAPPPNCGYEGGVPGCSCGTLVCQSPTPTCTPRPACLDDPSPCPIAAAPQGGWCPPITPVPGQCSLKPQGDANCDGKVDLIDFEIWRKEYRGELTSKDSDFNSDGKLDLIDFETWRKTYTGV